MVEQILKMKLTIETKLDKNGKAIAEIVMEGIGATMKTVVKDKDSEAEAMTAALHRVKHIYL